MILDRCSGGAVVAGHKRPRILKFLRHWLCFDGHIKSAELRFHVDDAFVAYRTFIGVFDVLGPAVVV